VPYPGYWRRFDTKQERRVFRSHVLTASDGYQLSIFESDHLARESVVLVNPAPTPFLLMSGLGMLFARNFNTVSWEVRGGAYLDAPCDDFSVSLDRHAADLVEVVRSAQTERIHCVGWCAGWQIIAWAVIHLGLTVRSISLVAPNQIDGGKQQTEFQRLHLPLVRQAAKADKATVQSIFSAVHNVGTEHRTGAAAEELLYKITDMNIESVSSFQQLARVVEEFSTVSTPVRERLHEETISSWFDDLCKRVPMLLIQCRDDELVSYRSSLDALGRNPSVKFILYPSGGHFVQFMDPSTVYFDIENFIRREAPFEVNREISPSEA
jgi:pimeloyl-ACP methyl ester carboxylesterase